MTRAPPSTGAIAIAVLERNNAAVKLAMGCKVVFLQAALLLGKHSGLQGNDFTTHG